MNLKERLGTMVQRTEKRKEKRGRRTEKERGVSIFF